MKKLILLTMLTLLPLCAHAGDTEKLTMEQTILELRNQNLELQVENATFRARQQYEANAKRIEEIKAQLAEAEKDEEQ